MTAKGGSTEYNLNARIWKREVFGDITLQGDELNGEPILVLARNAMSYNIQITKCIHYLHIKQGGGGTNTGVEIANSHRLERIQQS